MNRKIIEGIAYQAYLLGREPKSNLTHQESVDEAKRRVHEVLTDFSDELNLVNVFERETLEETTSRFFEEMTSRFEDKYSNRYNYMK